MNRSFRSALALISLLVASHAWAQGGGEPPATANPPSTPSAPPPTPEPDPFQEPRVREPGEPGSTEPALRPAAGEPVAGEPPSAEPASGEPASGEPASGEPASGEPASAEPAGVDPAALKQAAEDEAKVEEAPLRISGAVTERAPTSERLIIPPYVRDRHGDVTTTALFPVYVERKRPEDVQRFVLPYYYRRSAKLNADVALGVVWSLRGPDRNTFVLPPLYTHRRGNDWGVGLLPLFSTGSFSGRRHTVIPPLLTWYDAKDDHHRLIVGPYYDVQRSAARWRGLAPFFWSKHDDNEGFAIVPPVFWRFTQAEPFAATTVVPPFYHLRRKDETSWGLVPLLFRKRTPELRSTTVPLALFHHARGPNTLRLVTPLLAYLSDEREGSRSNTLITPLYQRRRGDRNLDAVAPLFFRTWDDRDMSRGLYLPPIYWHWQDPANRFTGVFPLFAHMQRDGVSDTLVLPVFARHRNFEQKERTVWVAPTFHYHTSETGFSFNVHPLFYLKRSPDKNHTALAPLWFDFENRAKKTRRTTLFPLYWDFRNDAEKKRTRAVFPFYWDVDRRQRDARYTVAFPFYGRSVVGDRTRHFVLNTMTEKKSDKAHSWQFHFFPLLSLGGSDHGSWWSVLYGLAGYDHRGDFKRMHAFWLPIDLNKKQ